MTILRFLLVLMVGCVGAWAQDYCSLIVQVVDPSGNAASGVPVKVEEANGRVVSGTAERGVARFCDLGVLPVAISVGFPAACNEAIVRNVPLGWSLTRTVKIVFDRAPCLVDGPPPILLCALLLRFNDEKGEWVAGVGFKPRIERYPNLQSDSYGRAIVRMGKGEEIHAATDKLGYLPGVIDLKCSNSLLERERTITLRKAP